MPTGRLRRIRRVLAAAGTTLACGAAPFATAAAADCVPVGAWVAPAAAAQRVAGPNLIARAAARPVVLLGELHDSAEHHRWQLQTIAALHALRPDMALAFEMFPRRVQPALDRWVAGELSEADFLAAAEWRTVWTVEPQLYLPIFHFARMNRVPMLAINVDRALTRAVSEGGFDAVPPERREGVTRPAPAAGGYLDALREAYAQHERAESGAGTGGPDRNDQAFRRFVESQLLWDRAMAQGIAAARARWPQALVVGVMGQGHLAHGYGVPHQLRDLGVKDVMTLLPWDRGTDCAQLEAGFADAVFGVAAPATKAAQRQRLGVSLELTADGVTIRQVETGSVAEAAGVRDGDIVREIAGASVRQLADVADAVQRQAPGTWLPLRVKRQAETIDLVAKFPPLAR